MLVCLNVEDEDCLLLFEWELCVLVLRVCVVGRCGVDFVV